MITAIDAARCVGHGLCYSTAPEVYVDDDEGYGRVRNGGVVDAEHEQAARNGAANCPERAITIS